MHWALESVFAGGYFVRICSDSLTAILTAAYTGREHAETDGLFTNGPTVTVTDSAGESLLRAVMLLVVAYGVLWPFIVIAMTKFGLANPLSLLLLLQLLAPTAWAGLSLANAVKQLQG